MSKALSCPGSQNSTPESIQDHRWSMAQKSAMLTMVFASIILISASGCNSGGRSGNGISIPGITSAAEALPFDNFSYVSVNLETSRYGHTATTLGDGRVLIVGGSDESLFSTIETVELYDQSLTADPQPASRSGDWITTDVNGDDIVTLNGGRIFHTATLLPDGNVLICGGSTDITIAPPIGEAEIYDLQTRQFNAPGLEPLSDMLTPRFHHLATLLGNGKVLIVGGQKMVDQTIIDTNFPPGSPFFQFDIAVFPSTETMEIYDTASREFTEVVDIAGNVSELLSPRGRSDHHGASVAGFDNRLGTTDDLFLVAGGYQTFSGVLAPDTKFAGDIGQAMLTNIEFYDLSTGVVSQAPGVTLVDRANGGYMHNLGTHITRTPAKVNPPPPGGNPPPHPHPLAFWKTILHSQTSRFTMLILTKRILQDGDILELPTSC